MNLTRYQNKDERVVHRTEIRNAPYNPRSIAPAALAKLRENIRKFTLQGSPTVNERVPEKDWKPDECGLYLVSGHQRLRALDALERSEDYHVRVSVVRLTPADERLNNAHHNNPEAQGDTDLAMLEQMLLEARDMGGDLAASSYDPIALQEMFSDTFGDLFDEASAPPAVKRSAEEAKAIADELKERKRAHKEKDDARRTGQELYTYVLWRDEHELQRFADALGLAPGERYVAGESVLALMKDE